MCGGGTTPILGRSGVPAIFRPPLGGGSEVYWKMAKGGGDIFWKSLLNSNFLNLKSITQTARFISRKLKILFCLAQNCASVPLETVSCAGPRNIYGTIDRL